MDDVEIIKSKIDLVEFLSGYLTLKKAGVNYSALCPFHAEKTPSFMISPQRQLWRCFGCDRGGDVFAFLEEKESMTFPEALEFLAQKTGVKLKRKDFAKSDQKERLYEINSLASKFYHHLLEKHPVGQKARDYLESRGISKKSSQLFDLGYVPNQWDLIFKFLTSKGFAVGDIATSGLVVGKTSGGFYDRFRNRIIFPLRDFSGKVLGFSARILDSALSTQNKEAKYINTSETPIFNKGSLLFGLDLAKESIKNQNNAILVEGEFDVISSFQAQVTNVVAVKGTSLTLNQIDLIKRFCENITFAFDADFAGDAAVRRAIEIADSKGLNVKVVNLKGAKDPDQIANKSKETWQKMASEAVGIYDFLIDSSLKRFDRTTADGKKKIGQEILPIFAKISDEIVKAHYLEKLAHRLDIETDVLWRALEKKANSTIEVKSVQTESYNLPGIAGKSRRQRLEEYFMALILQKNIEIELEKNNLPEPGDLTDGSLKKIYQAYIIAATSDKKNFDLSNFISKLDADLAVLADRLMLADVGKQADDIESYIFELEKASREISKLAIKVRLKELGSQIADAEKNKDTDKISVLKKRFTSLSSQLMKY